MSLDHYVSQVHLKQFLIQDSRKLLLATRKSDQKRFTTRPKDVCRVENGNTNPFLNEQRILERLLWNVEPAYERCLTSLRSGEVPADVRNTFAGFAAAVAVSSPTFKRLAECRARIELLRHARLLDSLDPFPPFPSSGDPQYDGKSIAELIDNELLTFDVNPQMPQALVAAKLGDLIAKFANSNWEIVKLKGGQELLTSDFPLAVMPRTTGWKTSRFLPLAPDIGILFQDAQPFNLTNFPATKFCEITSKHRVTEINRAIVMSAEELVFSNQIHPWLAKFVHSHSRFRLEWDTRSMSLVCAKRY